MPKQTTNYRLGYFVTGEFTDSLTESNRWNTLDVQLQGIYQIIGNGVLEGWAITQGTVAFSISVATGKGIIGFVSVESTTATTVSSLLPSRVNYIYAALTDDSYWTKNVSFNVYPSGGDRENQVFIGTVTTDDTDVTDIDITGRTDIGLYAAVSTLISEHHHIGGEDNPQPVDLSAEVQGIISQDNLPEADTSLLTTGVLPVDRIPELDHNTKLTNVGTITHAQLDSFANLLTNQENTVMGETALINFLQLVLSLKHQWPEVDEYLVNELAFIPGISPNTIIDTTNTTADVDTRTSAEGGSHTISGHPGAATEIFTKSFDTPEELEAAIKSNTEVDGDVLRLVTTEIRAQIEDFEDVSDWKTSILDLSSNNGFFTKDATTLVVGDYSGKLSLNVDTTTNLAFNLEKSFLPQDWSDYDKLVFFIKTDNVEHGDIYFYINDAIYGTQNSFILVLEAGAPTINRDTLMVGWREIVIDISSFNRTSINSIGLYTSTQGGWDASKPLELNIDNIYITKGNEFVEDGYARFTYGDDAYKNFWKIRWKASLPSGTYISVRTRLANDTYAFDPSNPNQAVWSAYNSNEEFEISNPTLALYKYIQIESFLESSPSRVYSPELVKLFLDTYISSSESQFTFQTKDEWDAGTLTNIDTSSVPGSILIDKISNMGFSIYGTTGKITEINDDLEDVLDIVGVSIPRSTRQVINGEPSSLGQISSVEKGFGDTYWLADTDNDRILQIDKTGNLLFALYGSFLNDPTDSYGDEDKGPGSSGTSYPQTTYQYENLKLLHAIYNSEEKLLNLVFNRPLYIMLTPGVNETRLDFNKIFLKSGAFRFYFNSSTSVNYFGIDEDKYASWYGLTNPFINQFNFNSHVLQLSMSQADAATLNSMITFSPPSVNIIQPYQNEIIRSTTTILSLVTNNITIGGSSNYSIRVKIDNGVYNYYTTTNITLSALSEMKHDIEVAIVDVNLNPLENAEAKANGEFIVDLSGSTTEPAIMVTSPHPNQIYSSTPVQISFVVSNFPILPVGSCIKYSVDGAYSAEHRSLSPISISGIGSGEHNIEIWLVDDDGDPLGTSYSETSITFFIGVNATSDLKVILDANAIQAQPNSVQATTTTTTTTATEQTTVETEDLGNLESVCAVEVGNVYMANIFAPIDIQFISQEITTLNPSGLPTVLVSKLRSPSSTYYLKDLSTTSATQVTAPMASTDIYGSKFMDGHSVVQFDTNGDVVFSNNAALFDNTRADAKIFLGSGIKISDNKVLIADSVRKRAIITHTNLIDQSTFVAWEYDSNRFVVDAQPVAIGNKNISVGASSMDPEELIIDQGTTVIWTNNSLIPITIYSGTTTLAQFTADPDLSLYGDEFVSAELQPGEGFSFKFNNLGEFDYFSYPSIICGKIYVSASGISSSSDEYILVENDGSDSAFGSRVIKVSAWGEIIWSFGEGILANAKDCRVILGESSILIST